MIAHAIAVLGRDRYGREVNPEHVLTLAVYHDATEVMTGDLPTPVKYYSEDLRGAYRGLEEISADRLLKLLPEEMRPAFGPCLKQERGYDWDLVKAADKISAYIKCAAENIRQALENIQYPEVGDFLREFLPAFSMTLDELNHPTQAQERNGGNT